MKRLRLMSQISNDFSEGLPVSKSDLKLLVAWERQNMQQIINERNRLRDLISKCFAESLITNQPKGLKENETRTQD